ncbi:Crp/Fnr family transcriptional regulator [Methylobacterium oxalidis]|uniref:Crp/Fnr family transcriptional regulator n=1 Tax=Methylobacterium oxalidis TaxID=944322 RepID=UPI00331557DD
MQDDLDRTRAWLLNDSRPALKRVAHLLCELHARLEVVGLAGPNGCELSLTQADVADAAAISHNHANRILQALFSEGFISLWRQKLIIADVQRLREFARFDLLPNHNKWSEDESEYFLGD